MDPSLAGTLQHRFMRNKRNIPPEIEWSQLRRRFTPGFEDILDWGVDEGIYDPSNMLEKYVASYLRFAYLRCARLSGWSFSGCLYRGCSESLIAMLIGSITQQSAKTKTRFFLMVFPSTYITTPKIMECWISRCAK